MENTITIPLTAIDLHCPEETQTVHIKAHADEWAAWQRDIREKGDSDLGFHFMLDSAAQAAQQLQMDCFDLRYGDEFVSSSEL